MIRARRSARKFAGRLAGIAAGRGTWRKAEPMPEMELLGRLAKGKMRIACIGAYGTPVLGDPSPAFLSQFVSGRRGSVIIVDNQDVDLLEKLEKRKKMLRDEGKKVPRALALKAAFLKQTSLHYGFGGLLSYREVMKRYAKQVPEFKTRRINLQPGLAWKTGLKEGSLDLVVDRHTLMFIKRAGDAIDRRGIVEKTLEHYISLVKKMGKVVLMFHRIHLVPSNERRQLEESIRHFLKEKVVQGFINVKEVPIENSKYKIGSEYLPPIRDMATALVITKK